MKAMSQNRLRKRLVTYELSFPRGLETDSVVSFVSGLSGLLLPWWRRLVTTAPVVILEIRATSKGVEHHLSVPESWHQYIENLMQASIPSVRFEPCSIQEPSVVHGTEYRLTNAQRELRVTPAALSQKLLSNLQP